jgi:hypothetical protein
MSDLTIHISPAPGDTLPAAVGGSQAVLDQLATIDSITQAEHVGHVLTLLKARRRVIVDHYDGILRPITAARNTVLRMKSVDLEPVERAERTLSAGLVVYRQREEDARRAALTEARLQAQTAAELKREEQIAALLKAAESVPALAKTAAVLQATPVQAPPVAVDLPKADLPGLTFRQTWTAEVEDPVRLVLAVAYSAILATTKVPKPVKAWFEKWVGQPVPLEALLPNLPWLNSMAKQFGATFSMPGVRAVKRTDVASRPAK